MVGEKVLIVEDDADLLRLEVRTHRALLEQAFLANDERRLCTAWADVPRSLREEPQILGDYAGYLQEMGVMPTSLSAAGYSEYQPATSNNTDEGKAQNRRIEIILMPNLDELPDLSSLEDELD